MKLLLSSFFLCFLFVCAPALSKDINKSYIVKASGIKIGKLDWELKINNETYSNKIKLKSMGFLSSLYKFEGEYFSKGKIKNKFLKPIEYTHLWKTNKKTKNMSLTFDDDKLSSLEQKPIENDYLRIDIFAVEQAKDPLTSFLQIIMGVESSLVLDGRRLYTMNASNNLNEIQTIIEISNYSNLWTDHKKNKFEKIIFEKNNNEFFPSKIFIYFDGRVFRLE